MSDRPAHTPQVEEYYDNLYVLNGAVMDKDSYEKHTTAAAPDEPSEAACAAAPETAGDPFSAPQDFRQMAAQAFDADRQAEYRPETAVFVPCTTETEEYCEEYVETDGGFTEGTYRILLGAPALLRLGSGSFRTSGSYRLSSGSFRRSSGSYRITSRSYRVSSWLHQYEYEYRRSSGSYQLSSGSFRRSSGSFRLSSGSFRRSSGSFRFSSGSFRFLPGSFRFSSGSFRLSSGSFRIPMQSYPGSFLLGMDAGGYGLNLI